MDLNGDGHVDLLSGSYSRQGMDMAGLFQVLWGSEDGFAEPTPLLGSDGEPLIVARGQGDDERVRICTRPSACDLNADGHLDLLVGNFEGSFHVFWGAEGHTFHPESAPLAGVDGPLEHDFHSDPFPVDWDGDGDLDIVSGSGSGRVGLALNSGSASEPRFSSFEALIPAMPDFGPDTELRFGHEHLTRPRGSTRVFVADVNGDGVHDLLVGDTGEVSYLIGGKTAEQTRAEYAAWRVRKDALMAERPEWDGSEGVEERQAAWQERFNTLFAELPEIVDKSSRGMVYLYLGSVEGAEVVKPAQSR